MKQVKELEIQRTGISAKQFYTYCKKKYAEKVNDDLENWTTFSEWVNPSYSYDISNNHEDWDEPKKEILKIQPYEIHEFLQDAYNFILEWNDNIGYMYHVEITE